MTQPLFLVPDAQFEEKTAGGERVLTDDPNQWPTEILQEAYQQCPFISDFEPQVTMDKVDGERGYGLGHLEIQNKTEIQHNADPAGTAAAGIQKVRIPIIIKDKKLQPLDLMVTADDVLLPLTENRLRQTIFRPQAFDITGRGPGDQSMIGQLYPPYRQNYGFGGGGATMNVGMGKEGSALEQYLEEKTASVLAGLKSGKFTIDGDGGEHSPRVGDWVHEGEGHMQLGKHHFRGYAEKKHAPRTGEPKHWHMGMGKEGSALEQYPEDAAKEASIKGCDAADTVAEVAGKLKKHKTIGKHIDKFVGRHLGKLTAAGTVAAVAGNKFVNHKIRQHENRELIREIKQGSILAAILPTISEADYAAFFGKVAADGGLQRQLAANAHSTGEALQKLASYTPVSAEKTAAAAIAGITPDVIQLRKADEGYILKTASHSCWFPKEEQLDRGQAYRLLGTKVVLAADATGAATMTAEPPAAEAGTPEAPAGAPVTGQPVQEPESPEEDNAIHVEAFGIYKVQDEKGRHLVGYVFPNLIDIDGTSLPIALFTNGSQYAVQSDIAGIHAGHGGSIFEGTPQGSGCFYHVLQNGKAEATIPMTVKGSTNNQGEEGVTLHCVTYDGREVQVSIQPNIQKVVPGENQLLIPDSFSWLPLDKAEDTKLVDQPEGFNKEAQAKRAFATVTLRGGGGAYSVSGFPVDKLASDERSFLDIDSTMFLLAGLGTDMGYVMKKLGQVEASNSSVEIRVGRYISPMQHQAKVAADHMANKYAPLFELAASMHHDLVKEAAIIPDPTAVDTVLSLGFLNAENLGIFVSYLPKIDDAQKKICELLLAARLGMRDIPIPALEKAMRTVEDVLEGLKQLAFTQ